MAVNGNRVAIVGAGLAGLACAARLTRAGRQVALFDKARGPGGRMSTRRIETPLGEAGFDHGAQYFTARGTSFRTQVEQWIKAGVAAPWSAAGAEAFVGVPGMNAPVRTLASDLSVAWGRQIRSLTRDGGGWRLDGPDGQIGPFETMVVAVPAEQAAVLLQGHDTAMAATAAASRTDPCWTVMAAFDQRLPIDVDTLREQGALGWAARNSSKPGRPPMETWVLQASPAWSREHLEDAPETVCAALLEALRAAARVGLPDPVTAQAHRWRYARSAQGHDQALWSPSIGLGCCGDWLIGPRVECAWDSGQALAARILGEPASGDI
jgi:predicted NAD/FAD-dependent oxidoreductase